MSRYPNPYAQHCDANCGCCEPIPSGTDLEDLETSGSFFMPESEADCGDQD